MLRVRVRVLQPIVLRLPRHYKIRLCGHSIYTSNRGIRHAMRVGPKYYTYFVNRMIIYRS